MIEWGLLTILRRESAVLKDVIADRKLLVIEVKLSM
jgi:hypothetical protein